MTSRFKTKRIRNKKYLESVRKLPCLACRTPWGGDAHHLRFAELSATGMKVGDNFCVPLCRNCHTQLHFLGREEDFWVGITHDPLVWASKNWKEFNNG